MEGGGGGRLVLVLVVVLLLCQGFNPIHPGRVEQAYSKCKMQKMQTAKCGGRLLLVVVVLLLWQGLNPIHPGRVEQPYLDTSICQTPLAHGSTTLYFLATVLSKFQVAVLDKQWPTSAKTPSSSSNVLILGLGKTIQCYEVRMMDDHLILT